MDIKSMNFDAEGNRSNLNNEKAQKSLCPLSTDKSLETGFVNQAADIESLPQKDFLLIELQDKTKLEEYKKVNLTLNKEANFINFFNEFCEGDKIYFVFEKPKNYLLGFLSSEFNTLSNLMRIALYKQSIEIVLKLKENTEEKFDFFNAHLFFVEFEKESFLNNYPILKLLYNGKLKITILFFLFYIKFN